MSVSWENQNLIKVPHFYRASSLLIPAISLALPYVFSQSQKVRPFRLNSKCPSGASSSRRGVLSLRCKFRPPHLQRMSGLATLLASPPDTGHPHPHPLIEIPSRSMCERHFMILFHTFHF